MTCYLADAFIQRDLQAIQYCRQALKQYGAIVATEFPINEIAKRLSLARHCDSLQIKQIKY